MRMHGHDSVVGRRAVRAASRRGAMLFVIAICMVLFVMAAAFSVDVAYMQLTRTELRTSVDAAARAAGHVIANGGTITQARTAAKTVASANRVASAPMTLADTNIVVGKANRNAAGVYSFTADNLAPNAVRVTAERTVGSANGAVNLFFGRMFGARRFEPMQSATVVRGDRDVMLVIDRSGSMMRRLDTQDFPFGCNEYTPPHPIESRWAILCQALDLFFAVLNSTAPSENVGIVTYGTNASFDRTLVGDYSQITSIIDSIGAAPIAGWTNLGEGLNLGHNYLTTVPESRFYAARTIILLTDGQPNVGPDPLAEAAACKAKKIVVHTVTFSDFADQPLMSQIAALTGGDYFHAPDAATLQAAFEKIGKDLPVVLAE